MAADCRSCFSLSAKEQPVQPVASFSLTVCELGSGGFQNLLVVEIAWVRWAVAVSSAYVCSNAACPVCCDLCLSPHQSEQSPKDMGHPCASIKDSARDNTAAFHTQRSKNEVWTPAPHR